MRRVVIESDLSGRAGATTIRFGLRGQLYEIDLTAEEFAGLRGVFAPYVRAGRRTVEGGASGSGGWPVTSAVERWSMRGWAEANGYAVQPRGRVPGALVAAYRRAQTPRWTGPARHSMRQTAPVRPGPITGGRS